MAWKIEQRVGIAAPVDDIYDLIADIGRWPEWSPIHQAATGELHFGAPVHIEERFEGLGVWEIDGVVADWSPLSHIHINVPKPFYAGKLIRYFEFEGLSETASFFTVGALFSGLLSEREGKRYGKFLRAGFAAFAETAKAKAEAVFATHPDHRAPVVAKEKEKPQLGPTPKKWLKTKMFVLPYQIK
jgi:hypothetical protein